jgi:hypothetical protein
VVFTTFTTIKTYSVIIIKSIICLVSKHMHMFVRVTMVTLYILYKRAFKYARVDILYITFIINLDRVSRRREGRESII